MTIMSTFLRRHRITILTPQFASDPYGGQTIDWALPPAETNLKGWMAQTGFDETPDASRLDDASRWLLWLPGRVTIDTNSRVVYEGLTFRVFGRPRFMAQPRGKGMTMIPVTPIEGVS